MFHQPSCCIEVYHQANLHIKEKEVQKADTEI